MLVSKETFSHYVLFLLILECPNFQQAQFDASPA